MANQFYYGNLLIKTGDTVVVHQVVKEGDKKRIQRFEGIVIKIRKGENGTFTVRKLAKGNIGVERIYPLDTPWIDKIELKHPAKVRRAKLYYLREKKTKKDLRFKKDIQRAEVLKKASKTKNTKKDKKDGETKGSKSSKE